MKKSRTLRSLPLVEVLVDTKAALFELMVQSGLQVLDALLEEDRTALCGPRYAHHADRHASRAGTVPSEVVLGGRKVAMQRPRVRAEGREVPLPTFQAVAQADPLNRRVVEQMLVGVATRHYARSLESVPAGVVSRGTSKSSVSRRFVAKTTAQFRAWQSAPLDGLDLVALLLDGVHLGDHCLVVALGIAADGQKHALGLWEGATENTAVCQSLLANLQSRGLRTNRSLLVILDGAQALHKATRAVFGEAALIQRCQVHKLRNILDHLPERQRPWVQAIVRRAYQATDVKTATRLLTDLAKRPGRGISQRRQQRTRGTRRDPDGAHAAPLGATPAITRDHECRRELAQPHPSCEAEREAVARRADDAALGGCRRTRSREGLSSAEGMRRYAPPRHRPPRTRPTARPGGLSGERRVESHPSRRRISTVSGTSPTPMEVTCPPIHGGLRSRISLRQGNGLRIRIASGKIQIGPTKLERIAVLSKTRTLRSAKKR